VVSGRLIDTPTARQPPDNSIGEFISELLALVPSLPDLHIGSQDHAHNINTHSVTVVALPSGVTGHYSAIQSQPQKTPVALRSGGKREATGVSFVKLHVVG
jgi:hypothetical protein